jgi:Ca2+/Na+ antiporter
MSVAAKNKRMELATSAIIGSQILNLQLALGLPWMITTIVTGESIDFEDPSIFLTITVALIVVLVCLALILLANLNLHYYLGWEMIIIYMAYLIFEYCNSFYVHE